MDLGKMLYFFRASPFCTFRTEDLPHSETRHPLMLTFPETSDIFHYGTKMDPTTEGLL